MTDITKRLRLLQFSATLGRGECKTIGEEAADEIDRLQKIASEGPNANVRLSEENDRLIAEIERLRAALLKKSQCVALHMGGNHCVGKCLDPKDCGETPIPDEQP